MKSNLPTRFFMIQQIVYGALMLLCALVWSCAHIIKGTMNFPGAVFSSVILIGAIFFLRLTWKDYRNVKRKENNNI